MFQQSILKYEIVMVALVSNMHAHLSSVLLSVNEYKGLINKQLSELSNLNGKSTFLLESRHFLLMKIIVITILIYWQIKKSKYMFGHTIFLK